MGEFFFCGPRKENYFVLFFNEKEKKDPPEYFDDSSSIFSFMIFDFFLRRDISLQKTDLKKKIENPSTQQTANVTHTNGFSKKKVEFGFCVFSFVFSKARNCTNY